MIRKVVLSVKWELFAEERADKEIETAHMILGIWTRFVQNRYPWTMFCCLNIAFHSVTCSFKIKTFFHLKEVCKAAWITGHRLWNKGLQTGWLIMFF